MAKYKTRYYIIFTLILSLTALAVAQFSRVLRGNNTESCTQSAQGKVQAKQYFVSTSAPNAVSRSGPGIAYDIFCKFSSRNTPLLVVDSYDNWRLVMDFHGEQSWIHVSLLSTRIKSAMCLEDTIVYKKCSTSSNTLCRIQKQTIVRLKKIHNDMCFIEFLHDDKRYSGYVETKCLFGATIPEITRNTSSLPSI